MASASKVVTKGVLRKYGAVIFFPTFTFATILADWTHTKSWKDQQKLKKNPEESKSVSIASN